MAAAVHGVLRASIDADAVLSLSTQELGSLAAGFEAAGFDTELRRGDGEDPIAAVLALTDSPQDLADAGYALAATKQSIDRDLLAQITKRFGRHAVAALNKLLAEVDGVHRS